MKRNQMVCLVVGIALTFALGCADDERVGVASGPDNTLTRLTALDQPRRGIYDEQGREVLLRGMNFNHLGDYFETDASLPNVAELGPDDWDDAAALGANVIRLVTTWSAWEPERDEIDLAYLARVREAVAEANARGMYVVIDMHQDAWSKFIFTPSEETCPEGTTHQKGWDGAPLWATFTDGEPTCTPGRREDSPAVRRAWDNFYANRDGILDELVELWAFIAEQFTDDAGVAGYDLINEPGNASNGSCTFNGITELYRRAICAIREVETQAGSPGHIIFFEPSVHGIPSALDLGGGNLVWAAHNYAESIGPSFPGLLDLSFFAYDLLARAYGTALWCGEYNSFSDAETNELWTARYAALEDRYLLAGGAWWQWEQECGDPHSVQYPPTPEWLEQQQERCGDARFDVPVCLARAYPRAVPGMLTGLSAEPCGEGIFVSGVTEAPGVADIWLPTVSAIEPAVTGTGIERVRTHKVAGGWRIEAAVDGTYTIEVTPAVD